MSRLICLICRCSNSHVPGYVENYSAFKKKGVEAIYVTSVNDMFVMEKWQSSIPGADKLRFIADSTGDLSKKLDLSFDATAMLGNERSKRYAMLVHDGKVLDFAVEKSPPEVTGELIPFPK